MDYPKKYSNQTSHKLKIQTAQTISRGWSNKINDINDQRESSMLSIIAWA